jgi:hypothetical protein
MRKNIKQLAKGIPAHSDQGMTVLTKPPSDIPALHFFQLAGQQHP